MNKRYKVSSETLYLTMAIRGLEGLGYDNAQIAECLYISLEDVVSKKKNAGNILGRQVVARFRSKE